MLSMLVRQFSLAFFCLYVIHFVLLIDPNKQSMAQDKKEETQTLSPSTPSTTTLTTPASGIPDCHLPIDLTVDSGWLETIVFGNFRVWHIMFSGIGLGTAITVVLCCLFRCRIPRTKQEIEADFLRKKICESFRTHLEKIKLDELQGNYDRHDLLPVYKKVELFEEDRIQKNEGFGRRKLNWKQKLKRFFSGGKDSGDEFGDKSIDESRDQSGAEYKKMTKEEMETVEKEVEGAKTDSSALNMINDQIAIFSFIGESKQDRKKRLKEQKKAEKALKKEQKLKEKLEKKLAKQEAKEQAKSGGTAGASSARAKSTQKLMELRGDTLTTDHNWSELEKFRAQHAARMKNGGESIIIDIEDSDQVRDEDGEVPDGVVTTDGDYHQLSEAEEGDNDKGYQEISLPIPDREDFLPPPPPSKKSLFSSHFSFRDTVQKLMSGFGGGGGKQAKKEALVINIEMVKKSDSIEEGLTQEGSSPPPALPQPKVSIPQIECSPPEWDEEAGGPETMADQIEQQQQQQTKKKSKKVKLSKNNSLLTKDESVDRNLLYIPSISKSTKEVNSERYEKGSPSSSKEEKKRRKEKDKELERQRKAAKEMAEPIIVQQQEEDKRSIKAHKEKAAKKDADKTTKETKEEEKARKKAEKESRSSKMAKGDKRTKEEDELKSIEQEMQQQQPKRSQLKRQTVAETGSERSSIVTVEDVMQVDKKHEAKVKDKDKKKEKEKDKLKSTKSPESKTKEQVEESKHKKYKEDAKSKSKAEKREQEQINLQMGRKDEEKKKDKSKVKHLKFDDEELRRMEKEKAKSKGVHKKDTQLEKGDRSRGEEDRLDTFPKVVEKVKEKEKQRKHKKVEIDIPNGEQQQQQAVEVHRHSKERRSKERAVEKQIEVIGHHHHHHRDHKEYLPRVESPKEAKHDHSHDAHTSAMKTSRAEVRSKEKDFNRLLGNVHEELKQRFEISQQEQRSKQLARSKTVDEDRDVISTDEDEQLLARSEFKKRLSEVMLQRTLMISKDVEGKGQRTMTTASRTRHIRMAPARQGTSSSEIEIPVEHVYTRGLMTSVVDVHRPPTPGDILPPSPVALLRHPISSTIMVPPSPSSSRSSTISVVTDNIRKKLVEASPETGENRELTYECSRDVIFDVQQQQHQHQRSQQGIEESTSRGESAKSKSVPEITTASSSGHRDHHHHHHQQPHHSRSSSPTRHRKKDQDKEKDTKEAESKHKGHHHQH